jgi:hypothetical protein
MFAKPTHPQRSGQNTIFVIFFIAQRNAPREIQIWKRNLACRGERKPNQEDQ